MESIDDFKEIKEVIIKSQKDEKTKSSSTQLIVENPNRKSIKKLNPKFCFEWETLDRDLQINRLIEYVGRYGEDNDLSSAVTKKLRKLLVTALVEENLQIEYDESLGIVTNIPKLYYNHDDGYYLGTYLNDQGDFICRISKISKCVESSSDLSITTEDFKTKKSIKQMDIKEKKKPEQKKLEEEPIQLIEPIEPIEPKKKIKMTSFLSNDDPNKKKLSLVKKK